MKTIKIKEDTYEFKKFNMIETPNTTSIYQLYWNPSFTKREIYEERNKKIDIKWLTWSRFYFTIYGEIKHNGIEYQVKITVWHNFIQEK